MSTLERTGSPVFAAIVDTSVNGFSPGEHRTLCPVKFFGIMALFKEFGYNPPELVVASKKATVTLSSLTSEEKRMTDGQ